MCFIFLCTGWKSSVPRACTDILLVCTQQPGPHAGRRLHTSLFGVGGCTSFLNEKDSITDVYVCIISNTDCAYTLYARRSRIFSILTSVRYKPSLPIFPSPHLSLSLSLSPSSLLRFRPQLTYASKPITLSNCCPIAQASYTNKQTLVQSKPGTH